jgi:hypothetical protein
MSLALLQPAVSTAYVNANIRLRGLFNGSSTSRLLGDRFLSGRCCPTLALAAAVDTCKGLIAQVLEIVPWKTLWRIIER